ncbi:MAG: adenylosuccinate synthetase [Nanoarchaeota archaeon]
MGRTIVIVGGQWGDEGKGKIVDFLTGDADIICRYQGGNNAGHTVVIGDDVYKFHLIPSGIVHKDKLNLIGNGTVIDPKVIASDGYIDNGKEKIGEIQALEKKGFKITDKNLVISSSAHVIQQKHIDEDLKTGGKVGTTGRGIGPCYKDKIARTGMRMGDYVGLDTPEAKKLKPLVKDTYLIVNSYIENEKNVLIEGAQGALLDIDHGTYPYVTSSNPIAGGACTGLGIGPTKIDTVIGIMKAYTTRVGGGPFTTELGTDKQTKDEGTWDKITSHYDEALSESLEKAGHGDEYSQGKYMRLVGREYGTTTGRPRRTGWFDSVAAAYAIKINGLSSVVVTKLDVLSKLKTIKICTHYKINSEETNNFPLNIHDLEKAKPVYEEMDGWDDDLTDVSSYDDLPNNAKKYLKRLEEIIKVPVCIVSVGPKRSQTIILRSEFLFK